MKLNKYDIPSLGKIVNESIFLNIEEDDNLITLIKIINSNQTTNGGISYINGSLPVALFTVNKKEKNVTLTKSFTTYEDLLKYRIIDETCDEPLLNRIHNDFISEFTKYMLIGKIDVS